MNGIGWNIEVESVHHRTWNLGARLRILRYRERLRRRRRLLLNYLSTLIRRPTR